VALLRAQKTLEKVDAQGDEAIGMQIVRKSLEAPLRQLVDNAGMEGALVVEEVKKGKGSYGYNVATGAYSDLTADGVLDPAKVTRTALQNAASIAGLLLTTECMVTEIPEKDKPMPHGGGPGGMGGGDMY
jgi:chaperonin GroEL